MRTKAYQWVYFLCFVAIGLTVSSTAAYTQQNYQLLHIKTTDGCKKFFVEIAKSSQQHRTGLMYREQLPANQGMLFVYEQPRPVSMWMKNTIIPLDILFINKDGQIVKIFHDAIPHSEDRISSEQAVIAVLEINAGASKANHISVGNKVFY